MDLSGALCPVHPVVKRTVAIGCVAVVGWAAATFLSGGAAFADGAPKLVAARSTTTGDSLTVSATCPRGWTAAGISAKVTGFAGVTIDEMRPDGQTAHAHATATQPVTAEWTLQAEATCIPRTSDIEYVTATKPGGWPGRVEVSAFCPDGKELIGTGWTARGGLTLTDVIASSATGGGYPGTGANTGTGGGGQAVTHLAVATAKAEGETGTIAVVAVCAFTGHDSQFVTGTASRGSGPQLSAPSACADGRFVYAPTMQIAGEDSTTDVMLRELWIGSGGKAVAVTATRARTGSAWLVQAGAVCSR